MKDYRSLMNFGFVLQFFAGTSERSTYFTWQLQMLLWYFAASLQLVLHHRISRGTKMASRSSFAVAEAWVLKAQRMWSWSLRVWEQTTRATTNVLLRTWRRADKDRWYDWKFEVGHVSPSSFSPGIRFSQKYQILSLNESSIFYLTLVTIFSGF